VQRECSCGDAAGLDGQCEDCRQEKLIGQPSPLQPKLRIGPDDDPYEREADRVADTVMRMPSGEGPGFSIEGITPLIQRQPIEEEEEEMQASRLQRQPVDEEEEEEEVQTSRIRRQPLEEEDEAMQMKRAPGRAVPTRAGLVGATSRGGHPLPAAQRAFFEPRFGFDFSDVRVHNDAAAASSARVVGAKAYTVGRNVVFGAGRWAPRSSTGRRLIAHELTHVVQQGTAPGASPRIQQHPPDSNHAITGVADQRTEQDLPRRRNDESRSSG
jgi:hypothetical protein